MSGSGVKYDIRAVLSACGLLANRSPGARGSPLPGRSGSTPELCRNLQALQPVDQTRNQVRSRRSFWYIQAIGLAGPWPFPMARQPRMAAVTKSLATATLSLTVLFCAKLAAIAEAKIQPEP